MAEQIAKRREDLMKEIVRANKDLVKRAAHSGLTFDLDADADTLTITIGDGGDETYTQGIDHVYADIDMETNKIVRFTIMELAAFLKTPEGKQLFGDKVVLPVLTRYGAMSFPPDHEGTMAAAEELRPLVPA